MFGVNSQLYLCVGEMGGSSLKRMTTQCDTSYVITHSDVGINYNSSESKPSIC